MKRIKKNKYSYVALILSAVFPVVFFQNCSDVGFKTFVEESLLPEGFVCQENDAPDLMPVLKYGWTAENEDHPLWKYVMATPSVADINKDGIPEIAFTTFNMEATNRYRGEGVLRIIDGKSGKTIKSVKSEELSPFASTTPLLIDIDGDGKGEIIYPHYTRSKIIALNHDFSLRWSLPLDTLTSICYGGYAAADLDKDGTAEIIADNLIIKEENKSPKLLYNLGATSLCTSFAASLNSQKPDDLQVITGQGVFSSKGEAIWSFPASFISGYSAVADIYPEINGVEVLTVNDSQVALFNGETGEQIWLKDMPSDELCLKGTTEYVGHGGPPAIGDFNGDGELDVAVATGKYYTVFNKQGEIIWKNPTRDCSSAITGSSLFDFNGDGKPEILYGDELFARIYDGATGSEQFLIPNPSGTLLEYPVVVDVDGNGSSEIIFSTNNYASDSFYDDAGSLAELVKNVPPGIRIFESQSKIGWVPTRKVWNQYSYFVNNVTDNLKATQSTPVSKGTGASLFRQNLIKELENVCAK